MSCEPWKSCYELWAVRKRKTRSFETTVKPIDTTIPAAPHALYDSTCQSPYTSSPFFSAHVLLPRAIVDLHNEGP